MRDVDAKDDTEDDALNASESSVPSASQSAPIVDDPTARNSYSDSPSEIRSEPPVASKYAGNQLKDGASPFDDCFGTGKYGGQSWIVFKNSMKHDAVVCLVDANSGKTIRNEYIQKGSQFKMTGIPRGTYYLKTFFGNDWNPKMKNPCGGLGMFETESDFTKSTDPNDWFQVEHSQGVPYWEVTLYPVSGGNMEDRSIPKSEFFSN